MALSGASNRNIKVITLKKKHIFKFKYRSFLIISMCSFFKKKIQESSNTEYNLSYIYYILYILQLYSLDQKGYYEPMRKASNFCVLPNKISKFKSPSSLNV